MKVEELIKNHETCASILEVIKMAEFLIEDNNESLKGYLKVPELKNYCCKLIHNNEILQKSIQRLFERYRKTLNNLIK